MSWKTPITLLVLLCVLGGAAFYGWQTVVSPATDDEPTVRVEKPKCAKVERFTRGQRIRSADITVNVLNAGAIGGLATDTLAILANRGFDLGVAGNAPANISATNVTILTDNRTTPQVQLVTRQFKGVVKYARSRGRGTAISVVVGDQFSGINQKALRSLVVKQPVRVCTEATGKS